MLPNISLQTYININTTTSPINSCKMYLSVILILNSNVIEIINASIKLITMFIALVLSFFLSRENLLIKYCFSTVYFLSFLLFFFLVTINNINLRINVTVKVNIVI